MRRTLAQWERSGLTLKEFGRRRGMAASTLSWWRHVFRRTNKPTSGAPQRRGRRISPSGRRSATAFTEVPLVASALAAPAIVEIVLRSGHVVRVPLGVEVARLRAVVAALEPSC
jgi:hypothetical protein